MRPDLPQNVLRLHDCLTIAATHQARYDNYMALRTRTVHQGSRSGATAFGRCVACEQDTWDDDSHERNDSMHIFQCCFCCLPWHPICSFRILQAKLHDMPSIQHLDSCCLLPPHQFGIDQALAMMVRSLG